MNSDLYNKLKDRGYIYQATHEDIIKKSLNGNPITFYLGIDPTADSLHIGHFFALMLFRHLQDAGHKGILVIGGATALIGDPSGKIGLRKMLSKEQVNQNLNEVRKLAERFIKVEGENPATILNNGDWINPYSYVDFMRDVGVHFNINKMLSAETYANRLSEGGLTFLEMGYMLMQSYDFVYLNEKFDCTLQIGGSDQWGNIVAGVNLGRKIAIQNDPDREEANPLLGLTCPLLMTKDGKKMGKTEQGTLWVAREKTTVFDFYQYFYNVSDQDTEMLLKLFTYIESDKIDELCINDIVEAKRIMAYEITKLVHGKNDADQALAAAQALFSNGINVDTIPSVRLDRSIVFNEINIIELLTITNFMQSKAEARRMIQQGGIAIDDTKVINENLTIALNNLDKDYILLKKGKKTFLKVQL